MAQWEKALVAKAVDPENLEFDPWGPPGGMRELIPESCPLTSHRQTDIHTDRQIHTHTYTENSLPSTLDPTIV